MQTEHLLRYPPLRLDHLERLTDSTGVLQHALHAVPDPRHGYSIDDQARALIVVLAHAGVSGLQRAPRAAYTYLSYIGFAETPHGSFHNFLSYNRTWLDEHASADAHGRALWALGYASRFGIDRGLADAASDLFDQAAAGVSLSPWIRPWAFTIFGLYHRIQARPDASLSGLLQTLANQLVGRFDATAGPTWRWFEDVLTYCNAKLPAALLLAYEITGERRYLEVGLTALEWLFTVVAGPTGIVRLVGQAGWYPRGSVKAPFDEQCVDAQGLVEAAIIAYRVSKEQAWRDNAWRAFDWFFGHNVHGVSLIDPATWGCFDGITVDRLNRNMGAESIVCYLLAYLDLVAAHMLTLDGAVPQGE